MNFESNYQSLMNSIFNGEKDIAIFVLNGNHYYVIDSKDNYCIDARVEYQSYIDAGWMKAEQYEQAISFFRHGIPALSKENFGEYLKRNNVLVFSVDWMRQFFISGSDRDRLVSFYNYVEIYLSSLVEPVSQEWDGWRMRLPKFYINFDKKIYRHTDWGRLHETSVPSGWDAQANSNFGFLVPDKYQYWLITGMNFWKLYM